MTQMIHAKKMPAFALGSTGLVSAAALMAGTSAVQAEGMYAGISYGFFNGTPPQANDEVVSDPNDYDLDGGALGVFVGAQFVDFGNNLTLGGELAFSGNVEGDPDGNSGNNDNSYDIDWVADAKLRLGTTVSNFNLYGFVGATVGTANTGYENYSFHGYNFGLGAETSFANNMFAGVEFIQREVDSYNFNDDTDHNAISLRVGFKF
jgi:hypothetical protein